MMKIVNILIFLENIKNVMLDYYINSNGKCEKCNDDNCLLCDHTEKYCSIWIDVNIINILNKDANEEDILI